MRNGQILAVAQLVAVLRKLIVGRQVVGQSERNGVFNVRARDSIAAPAGDQRAGLRGTAFKADCHRHAVNHSPFVDGNAPVANLSVSVIAVPVRTRHPGVFRDIQCHALIPCLPETIVAVPI